MEDNDAGRALSKGYGYVLQRACLVQLQVRVENRKVDIPALAKLARIKPYMPHSLKLVRQ
jgi:hypothetical protein